ncbi:ParA family protein [Gammaproteobacteria bacterium]|nr:ParA family protein [Gammaproteobacteria bacterium]
MNDYKYLLTLKDFRKLWGAAENSQLTEIATTRLKGNQSGIPPEAVRKFLKDRGVSYRFRVVTVANLKGGIGKTTAAISSATRAAQYGFKSCILDLDPQASASLALNCLSGDDEPIFYDIWQNPEDLLVGALKHVQPNLSVLPSSLENSLLDTTLLNPASQKDAVANVCQKLRRLEYDLVIVDCPPSLGAGTISAICAASTIVIPINNDSFSFKGLDLTVSEVHSICNTFRIQEPEIKVLFSRYDRRESISADAIGKLENEFSEYLLPVFIRTSTKFSKALSRNETVFASGAKSNPREDYDLFTRTLLNIET